MHGNDHSRFLHAEPKSQLDERTSRVITDRLIGAVGHTLQSHFQGPPRLSQVERLDSTAAPRLVREGSLSDQELCGEADDAFPLSRAVPVTGPSAFESVHDEAQDQSGEPTHHGSRKQQALRNGSPDAPPGDVGRASHSSHQQRPTRWRAHRRTSHVRHSVGLVPKRACCGRYEIRYSRVDYIATDPEAVDRMSIPPRARAAFKCR
jgi:hypothetical protein